MKSHWQRLRPAVLRRIRPTAAQTRAAHAAANRIATLAKQKAAARGVAIEPELVGSLAKDTHLRPRPDIDVFMLFSSDTPRAELEAHGLAIGRSILNAPSLRYAEHPYVHGTFRGFRFDVVPAYRIEQMSARLSAVDRSPFHAAYVRKHLRPSQRDEVRILKQFLKGIGCYGAETTTGGFSGYMAELLVLKFGTFWETLMALRERNAPIRLSLQGSPDSLGGDLVFVDPVDKSRNAAAAVTMERLDTFLRAARAFTARPAVGFFWPRPLRAASAEKLLQWMSHRGILALALPTPKVREQAVEPHVRRFADKVARRLGAEGFRVVRHAVHRVNARRMLVLVEYEPILLPETYIHQGPPSGDPDHSRRFLQKWQSHPDALELPHPERGRWQVRVRRRQRGAAQIVARQLRQLLEGVELSVPQRKKVHLASGPECVKAAAERAALTRFLDPRDPWEPST